MGDYNENHRYLEVSGTAYEMAYKQGRAFRYRYERIRQAITKTPFLPAWLQRFVPLFAYTRYINKIGRKYLELHGPLLANYNGRNHLQNLDGLAAGFEQSKEHMYGINAIEIITSHMAFSMGCSSLGFGGQHTASGQPKIAYNHDFPDAFGHLLYVQKNTPNRGYASLTLSYPVILGAIAGVNDQGLAISLNHAFATDFCDHPAILFTLLVQECLSCCATVNEALELIKNTPVPNGSILTLLDKSGKRVAVEFSCTQRSFRFADADILHTFNFYQQPEMQNYQVPLGAKPKGMAKLILKDRKIHEHNVQREKRYFEIVDHAKKYTDDDIQHMLSDHYGTEGEYFTICRHDTRTMSTIASTILSPAEQSVKIIYGNPCRGKYRSYSLKGVARDAA